MLSISSAIVEDVENMRETMPALIVYYYFDLKDASKRDLRGLLSSLLFQLGYLSDRCWDILYQLYLGFRDGSEQPSEVRLTGCLKNMLELQREVPIFIFMDALDECPSTNATPSARTKILDFLKDLIRLNHPNLFICITSCPEQDIDTVLDPLIPVSFRVSLQEEQGQRKDIDDYIHSFVDADRAMCRWREEDKALVIRTLSERANGLWGTSNAMTHESC